MWTSWLACNDTQPVNWPRIGELLKDLRAHAKLTNASAFARHVGVNKSTVGRIEKGEVRPTLETIELWVLACGSKLSAFFLHVEAGTAPAEKALHVQSPDPDGSFSSQALLGFGRVFFDAAALRAEAERAGKSVPKTRGRKSGSR